MSAEGDMLLPDEEELRLADDFLASLSDAGINVYERRNAFRWTGSPDYDNDSPQDSSSSRSLASDAFSSRSPRPNHEENRMCPTNEQPIVGISLDDNIHSAADDCSDVLMHENNLQDEASARHNAVVVEPVSAGALTPEPQEDIGEVDDPDYQPSNDSEDEDEVASAIDEPQDDSRNIEPQGQRKRKRVGEPESWVGNKNKKLREMGLPYLGWKKKENGKYLPGKFFREGRKLGPPCTSSLCLRSQNRFCDIFSETEREELFRVFWSGMTWEQRKIYVASLVTIKPVARRRSEDGDHGESRRNFSSQYHLKKDGQMYIVCKTFFLSTLGLKETQVAVWAREGHVKSGIVPARKNIRRESTRLNRTDFVFVKEFFDSLAKLPSHYCRKSTSKVYLEPVFSTDTLSAVYREYKDLCDQSERIAVSRFTFTRMAKKLNLGFQLPKKDKCDTCCEHEVGNVSQEQYLAHIASKDEARKFKEADKARAENGEITMLVMDLMAVKMCPLLNASSLYYKTKLCVHNFTIFNAGNKHCQCYWFEESQCDLSSDTFASLIVDYLLKNCDFTKDIVIWSDNCGYQNKCAGVSNALLILSCEKNVTIYQKYLQRGHTQMEVDSVHASIERVLQNKRIFLPSDYMKISQDARLQTPYEASMVGFELPKTFSSRSLMRYPSIRPGRKSGDPTVSEIKVLKYSPNGTLQLQTAFDGPFMKPAQRPTPAALPTITEIPSVRNGPIKINKRKWDDLQALLPVIPRDCHSFYKQLPH